jgi:hypothetical protein
MRMRNTIKPMKHSAITPASHHEAKQLESSGYVEYILHWFTQCYFQARTDAADTISEAEW